MYQTLINFIIFLKINYSKSFREFFPTLMVILFLLLSSNDALNSLRRLNEVFKNGHKALLNAKQKQFLNNL